MLLAIKLKNRILRAASSGDLPIEIKLKNCLVNEQKRGCSGFVRNPKTGSCVYVSTEEAVYGPLSKKCLYRYSKDMDDTSSNDLVNGYNRFCTAEELPEIIIRMLREGKGILKS